MSSYGLRNTAFYLQGDVLVERDARIPIEASGGNEVFRDARIPVEAAATILRDGRIPVDGHATIVRDAAIPIDARASDAPILRFVWDVLQPVDAPQAFTWTVLEVVTVGGELRFQWRVVDQDPGQGFTWTVIPAELLELFASQGAGAAAGIAPDTLLPVGRATKD